MLPPGIALPQSEPALATLAILPLVHELDLDQRGIAALLGDDCRVQSGDEALDLRRAVFRQVALRITGLKLLACANQSLPFLGCFAAVTRLDIDICTDGDGMEDL